jgi:hypothetical protein
MLAVSASALDLSPWLELLAHFFRAQLIAGIELITWR